MSVLARAQMGLKAGWMKTLRLVEQVNLPMMLHWEDNSMARSIEARVPLDHELVEQTLAMPLEARLHYGVTKRVLRQAMANILPAKFCNDNSGLCAPEDVWMRRDLRDWARKRVGDTLGVSRISSTNRDLGVVDKTLAGKRFRPSGMAYNLSRIVGRNIRHWFAAPCLRVADAK